MCLPTHKLKAVASRLLGVLVPSRFMITRTQRCKLTTIALLINLFDSLRLPAIKQRPVRPIAVSPSS